MPQRKETKETVTYPASKRKAPPFKPHRPTKLSRTSTAGSGSSTPSNTLSGPVAPERSIREPRSKDAEPPPNVSNVSVTVDLSSSAKQASIDISDEDDDMNGIIDDDDDDGNKLDESSDEFPDNPLQSKPIRPAPPKRKDAQRLPSSSPQSPAASLDMDDLETRLGPPDTNSVPSIPQPLLLRLMHEHFESKDTKIDKHAIVVFQRYLDVFVREAIARAALSKKEDVDEGKASQSDVDWLDRRDLEKISGGMILDF